MKLSPASKILFEEAQEDLRHLINQKSLNPLIPDSLILDYIKLDKQLEETKNLGTFTKDSMISILSTIGAIFSIMDKKPKSLNKISIKFCKILSTQ